MAERSEAVLANNQVAVLEHLLLDERPLAARTHEALLVEDVALVHGRQHVGRDGLLALVALGPELVVVAGLAEHAATVQVRVHLLSRQGIEH